MTHTLLVANDFPPKHGGIQSYLWELVRRLPPASITVLTTPYDGDTSFDAAQPFRVVRTTQKVMLPTPALARQINDLAREVGATTLLLDPPIPLGLLHRRLELPYAVVIHGGVVGYARPPITRQLVGRVLAGARHVISAGGFPAGEAIRAAGGAMPPVTVIPPGVDLERFHPLDAVAKADARRRLGLPVDGRLIVGISRLVPRKGFDVLIEAVARLAVVRHDLHLAIGSAGRDRGRLVKLAASARAPVTFMGRVPDADLAALHGAADVFAMVCRERWMGLEQEGFGVVFLEAAACGVPQIVGESGGAAEAVEHGITGLVVDCPEDPSEVADALAALLDDPARRARMGAEARDRVEADHSYEVLAARLAGVLGSLVP